VAAITAQIRKAHGTTPDEIPVSILKSLPQDELLDRLAHADDLAARAARTRDPVLAEGYGLVAKAVLAAQPRDAVVKEIARRYLQARRTRDPRQAAALRESACKLMEHNPPAPKRAEVAKARARTVRKSGRVKVYTADGDLIGDIDQSDLQTALPPEEQAANRGPVNTGGTTGLGRPRVTGPAAALPADGPQRSLPGDMPGRTVVKAKSGGSDQVAVFNQNGDLVGVCDAAEIQPVAEAKPSIHNPKDPDAAPSGEVGTPADAVAKATAQKAAPTAAVVKAAFRNARTAAEQNEAFTELNAAAATALDIIHGRSATPRRRR
jgi:hypothetical protein